MADCQIKGLSQNNCLDHWYFWTPPTKQIWLWRIWPPRVKAMAVGLGFMLAFVLGTRLELGRRAQIFLGSRVK